MADPIDRFQARDTAEGTALLERADRDRTWANTFSNTPPSEVLRANRNYDQLLADAIDRRGQIQAQTEPKAQILYFNSRLQPLKEELERGRIAHEAASTITAGATTRFHQQQDTETMGHIVGFADYMENAPAVGSPEYTPYVLRGVQKFPRIVGTAWGKDTLGKIALEHDTIQTLTSQIPSDMAVESVTIGGGKQSHVTARKTSPDEGDLASELKTGYGLTLGQVKNPVAVAVGNLDSTNTFKGDHKGGLVEITTGKGEKVHMSVPEFQRFGGKFSAETEVARKPADTATTPDSIREQYKAGKLTKERASELLKKEHGFE